MVRREYNLNIIMVRHGHYNYGKVWVYVKAWTYGKVWMYGKV